MAGSSRLVWGVSGASLALTLCSACVWDKLIVTGAYFWVTSDNVSSRLSRAVIRVVLARLRLAARAPVSRRSPCASVPVAAVNLAPACPSRSGPAEVNRPRFAAVASRGGGLCAAGGARL